MIVKNLSYTNEDKYIYATASWDEKDLIVTIEVTDTNVSKWRIVKATFDEEIYCEGTNEIISGIFQAKLYTTYELQIYNEKNNKYIHTNLFTITDIEFSNSKNARIATYSLIVKQGKGTRIRINRAWSTSLQMDKLMYNDGTLYDSVIAFEDFFYIYVEVLKGYTIHTYENLFRPDDGDGNGWTGPKRWETYNFDISDNTFQTSDRNWTMENGQAGNITVITSATPNVYKVTFNANGGSVSTESKQVTYDKEYGDLPTPTKTGYSFLGWFTATSGGTQVTKDTIYNIVADNQTLYAQWTPIKYTIAFNKGTGTSGTMSSMTCNYGTEYTLTNNAFQKTGYYFYNWSGSNGKNYSNQAKISNLTTTNGATITLTAQWRANTYKVTFNANGGSVSSTSVNIQYDSKYNTITLPTPTRSGYTFAGWYTAISGGTKITSDTIYKTAGNSTIYAHWNANIYTLTYNANGGSVSPTSKQVTYNNTYGTLPTPSRPGYSFLGWYTTASGGVKIETSTKYTTIGNSTIYAHWDVNTYTITFDANGGSVSPASVNIKYNSKYNTVTLPTPIKIGYKFLGWFTSISNGTQITSDTTYTTVGNSTIYAYWEPIGTVRLWINNEFKMAQAYIYANNKWNLTLPYTYAGLKWNINGG